MKPGDRILLAVVVAAAVFLAVVGAYLLLVPSWLSTTLPVPAGTAFSENQTEHWAAHFDVGPAGGTVVGAWTAYHGAGWISLIVVNGTVSKPWPPPLRMCPLMYSWSEFNGTSNAYVQPGPHTAYWSTGYCSTAQSIVVTQAIQLGSP